MKQTTKVPPIKIQGIKTKLVPFIMKNVKWDRKGKWVEPFLGSGVVAFNVCPERALLADTNKHIIRFYRAIQDGKVTAYNSRQFLELEGRKLKEIGEEHYYNIRERFNAKGSPFDFLFLNRACFNGVIRFNKQGHFNVPFCRKPDRFAPAYITKICNQIDWVSRQMRNRAWVFVAQDWRVTLSSVEANDFVYIDPPYNDRHTDYYNQWSAQDADELAEEIRKLKCHFAYSTWKGNKYRRNEHLERHFSDFPIITQEHFYHVGSKESLRNSMEEALVIAPRSIAGPTNGNLYLPDKQLKFNY